MEQLNHLLKFQVRPMCLLKISLIQLLLAVISRIALDPLKEFPGPLAAKITNGYGGFYALKRRLYLETYKNHLKYGTRSHFAVGSKIAD